MRRSFNETERSGTWFCGSLAFEMDGTGGIVD